MSKTSKRPEPPRFELDGMQMVAIAAEEYELLLANRRQVGAQGPRLQALRREAQHAVDCFREIETVVSGLGHGVGDPEQGLDLAEDDEPPARIASETCADGIFADGICTDHACLRCTILRTIARATSSVARFGIAGSG